MCNGQDYDYNTCLRKLFFNALNKSGAACNVKKNSVNLRLRNMC